MRVLNFDPGSCHILVVDDEEMNRDMLCRRLERKGYRTTSAIDGFEALEMIDHIDFDVVLLDVMMPRLSGLEVLHTVRQTRSALDLPVVVVTAKTETDDILSALKLGANDYIAKPIQFDIALARVQNILSVRFAAKEAGENRGTSRFEALVTQSVDLVSEHAEDGTFHYASPAAQTLLGYDEGELVGQSLFALLHLDDRSATALAHPSLPDVHTLVGRLRRKDGAFVWVEMVTRATRDAQGAVHQIAMTTRDLTPYVNVAGVPEFARRAGS